MHEYTEDEVRQAFLEHVWEIIDYWEGQYNKMVAQYPCRKKLEGLAFSLLVMLDGESADIPGFIVAPYPHPDDKDYLQGRDENWYPENHNTSVKCDLGGSLHDHFHNVRNQVAKAERGK